jgi:UDP-glucose 4-epimerase
MQSSLTGYHIYNVGSGKEITVKDLWDAFREISGFAEDVKYLPARDGDIKASLANISRIKSDLGFSTPGDFKSNLNETYRWLKSQING